MFHPIRFLLTTSLLALSAQAATTTLQFHYNLAANFDCQYGALTSLTTLQVTPNTCADVSNVKLSFLAKKWEAMNAATLPAGCSLVAYTSPNCVDGTQAGASTCYLHFSPDGSQTISGAKVVCPLT